MTISKKRAVLSLFVIIVVAAVIFLSFYFFSKQKTVAPVFNEETVSVSPTFMTSEEKGALFIPSEQRVQVLQRSEDGQVMVYKLINSDTDVLNDGALDSIRPEKQ
jgi:hypothetical protein